VKIRKKYIWACPSGGKTYFYFRRKGILIRLPDDPNSREFDVAYWSIMNGSHDAVVGQNRGNKTFGALITKYRASTKFQNLSDRSRKDYLKILDYIGEKLGDIRVAKFERPDAMAALEKNSHRPRSANYVIQVLSILFEHAIDLGWRRDNPAKGITKYKKGEGYKPWSEAAIEAYRNGTTGFPRLIFELALGTGQRPSDLTKMRWSDIRDGGIEINQGKTGSDLWIPLTPTLDSHLREANKEGIFILSSNGQQCTYDQIEHAVRSARREAGTMEYTLHGLRYNAASELAEAGCSSAEIGAITGHKTLQMIEKYTRGARQKILARQAQARRAEHTKNEK